MIKRIKVNVARKKFNKLLCIILVLSFLSISLSHFPTPSVGINSQYEKIKKYLFPNETIVSEQILSFGSGENQITLINYSLSSGKYILYSLKHDTVVLGNEWMGIKDAEFIALELLSLCAYKKYNPISDEEVLYNMYNYWEKGAEIAKKYFEKRIVQISSIKLAAGLAIITVSVILTGGVSSIVLIGYGGSLATALLIDLPANLKINEENSPRLFTVLALMAGEDEAAYENFKKAVERLSNPPFEELIEKIVSSLKIINTAEDIMALSGLNFMVLYTFAARDPTLLSHLESMLGKEALEKAGAFLIFGGGKESLTDFQDFSTTVSNYWKRVPGSGSKLSDILTKKAVGTLGSIFLTAIIDSIADYTIKASKDVDSALGFHGAHSILIRDLYLDLGNFLSGLKTQKYLPTLKNVQSFFFHKYLLYSLLDEYDEGISKLDTSVLYNLPEELVNFWGFEKSSITLGTETETWAGNILGWFTFLKSLVDQEARDILVKFFEYNINVYKMFDDYKQDMAKRRTIPGPLSGVDLFIVMDVSGSMDDRFANMRKIDAAKKGAIDLVSLTSRQDRIGSIKFSDSAELLSELTSDKNLIINKINALQPEGSTALGDGIWLGVEKLESVLRKEARPSAIIVLTDGMHNAGVHSPQEAALKAKNLNIPVYTLGFGEKGDIDEATLIDIAQITGAQYYYAPSVEDLRKIYIDLSQQVSGSITETSFVGKIKKGEEQVFTTNVDAGTTYLSIRASYTGSKVNMILQKPSGLVLSGTEGNVVFREESNYISFLVYYPDPGKWKIKIIGIDTPAEGEEYRLSVAKPGLIIDPPEINVNLKPGESIRFEVKVKALRPLSSVEVVKLGSFEFIEFEEKSFKNLNSGQEFSFHVTVKAPSPGKGFLFRGFIGIRAVDSLIFLPINVQLGKLLIPILSTNASSIFQGESLNLLVRVSDEKGKPVSGAFVEVFLATGSISLVELGGGYYGINLTSLTLGRKNINLNVSKAGYYNASASLSILVTVL
ncbi:MAG: VWA domain-containing protein, partial [Candidatus Aenigmatarchaeota archaeon]